MYITTHVNTYRPTDTQDMTGWDGIGQDRTGRGKTGAYTDTDRQTDDRQRKTTEDDDRQRHTTTTHDSRGWHT